MPCIEQRWADSEQPLFVLALLLHPTFRPLFLQMDDETELTNLSSLCQMATFYYKRLISEDVGQIREEMVQWKLSGVKAYSVDDPNEFSSALSFWAYVKLSYKVSDRPQVTP